MRGHKHRQGSRTYQNPKKHSEAAHTNRIDILFTFGKVRSPRPHAFVAFLEAVRLRNGGVCVAAS